MSSSFDVLIIGGGMVGLTLACALGDSSLRVAVVEKFIPDELEPDADYDLRVSAISRSSQQVFENLGVWPGILKRRCCAYEHMHVWDAEGTGEIHFDAADIGVSCLGHIIENRVVQLALLERLKQFHNIELISGSAVVEIDYNEKQSRVLLDDNRALTGRLLVGADGANSRVRETVGIDIDIAAYEQQGIVSVVQPELHHQHTAWQHFLPTGPLAFLPLADGHCSIVWSADSAQAERLLELDDESFQHELAQAFGHRLGDIKHVGPRAAFPLKRRHANAYIREGLALVGDAAHTIHPLAGQGANLGLMDAACLAEVIQDAARVRRDFGSHAVLRRYERWRRGENLLMMYSMSGFKNLFGNDNPVISGIRNVGLSLVQKAQPVKNLFIRRAMGLEGDLPAIARVSRLSA